MILEIELALTCKLCIRCGSAIGVSIFLQNIVAIETRNNIRQIDSSLIIRRKEEGKGRDERHFGLEGKESNPANGKMIGTHGKFFPRIMIGWLHPTFATKIKDLFSFLKIKTCRRVEGRTLLHYYNGTTVIFHGSLIEIRRLDYKDSEDLFQIRACRRVA